MKIPIRKNLESLHLYRDILRGTKQFVWPNEQGILWKDILRQNARKEFEQARYENDPIVVTRLLLVGRDCLNQTLYKFEEQAKKLHDNIDATRNR